MAAAPTRVDRSTAAQKLAPALWTLLALFLLRVAAQAFVALAEVPWLPPMAEWHSGLLPYPLLLPTQLAIAALLARVCFEFGHGAGIFVRPRRAFATYVWWFGWLYAASMLVRYVMTMALRPEARWSHGTIPIAFHIVLATFTILFAHHHRVALVHPAHQEVRH